jgi:hypothetical protein
MVHATVLLLLLGALGGGRDRGRVLARARHRLRVGAHLLVGGVLLLGGAEAARKVRDLGLLARGVEVVVGRVRVLGPPLLDRRDDRGLDGARAGVGGELAWG